MLKSRVKKPGQWAGLWNEITGELLVHNWSTDKDIGKKYVLSNAYQMRKKKPSKYVVPAYDDYAVMFRVCDVYNTGLGAQAWPFRSGGGTEYGDLGCLNSFYMCCILRNVMHAYMCEHNIPEENFIFQQQAIELADEIYSFISTNQM